MELQPTNRKKMTGRGVVASHYFPAIAKNCNPLHGKELSVSNSKKMQGRMGVVVKFENSSS
jgi:hypothetical protein